MAASSVVMRLPFRRIFPYTLYYLNCQFDPRICSRMFLRGTRRNTEYPLEDYCDDVPFSLEKAPRRLSVPLRDSSERDIRTQSPSIEHQEKFSTGTQLSPAEDGSNQTTKEDFFGIESEVGFTHVKQTNVCLEDKYAYLLRNRKAKVSDEILIPNFYGTIRYDRDNQPLYHGQYEDDTLKANSKYFATQENPVISSKLGDSALKSCPEFDGGVPFETDMAYPSSTLKSDTQETINNIEPKSIHLGSKSEENNDLCFASSQSSPSDFSESCLKPEYLKSYTTDAKNMEKSQENQPRLMSDTFHESNKLSKHNFKRSNIKDNSKPSAENSGTEYSFIDDQYFSSELLSTLSNVDASSFQAGGNKPSFQEDSSFIDSQNSLKSSVKPSEEVTEGVFSDKMNSNNSVDSMGSFNLPHEAQDLSFIDSQYFGSLQNKPTNEFDSKQESSSVPFSGLDETGCDSNRESGIKLDKVQGHTFGSKSPAEHDDTSIFTQNQRLYSSEHIKHNENMYEDVEEHFTDNGLKDNVYNATARQNINLNSFDIGKHKTFGRMPDNIEEKVCDEHHGFHTKRIEKSKNRIKPCIEDPKTAFDYVMKMRKEKKTTGEEPRIKKKADKVEEKKIPNMEDISNNMKENESSSSKAETNFKPIHSGEQLDSKGYRVLKNQIPQLWSMPRDALLNLLKDSVLYNDNDIVAIDKPYGLICQGNSDKSNPCLQDFMSDLAKLLDKKSPNPQLYTVHRLDKNTTGVLLLAKTQKMQSYLNSLFSEHKITKVYWVLTNGIPSPVEGVIDIPIAEGAINGRTRMVLRPEPTEETKTVIKNPKNAHRAVTHYKVLSENAMTALVEVTPETGLKHQIRVHLGFGLRCPVLGDHKYSYLDRLAPQKLFGETLVKLGVRQSKVRHIPMHLYSRVVVIPEMLDGRNLFIHAPMPLHFAQNMKRLGLKKK